METHAAGSVPRRTLGGGAGFFVFPVLAALLAALLLAAACAPFLRTVAPPPAATPAPAPPGLPEACDLPDVDDQVVEAAWAYVHARYPVQPWPDTVYLPDDWAVVVAARRHLTHVVLCSHATGFVWEGEVAWRARCACCLVDIDGVKESFVAIAAPAASSTPLP